MGPESTTAILRGSSGPSFLGPIYCVVLRMIGETDTHTTSQRPRKATARILRL